MTDTLILGAGVMVELFILMVVLAPFLAYRPNRLAHVSVGVITVPLILSTATVNDQDDYFFAAVQILGLAAIAGLALACARVVCGRSRACQSGLIDCRHVFSFI